MWFNVVIIAKSDCSLVFYVIVPKLSYYTTTI